MIPMHAMVSASVSVGLVAGCRGPSCAEISLPDGLRTQILREPLNAFNFRHQPAVSCPLRTPPTDAVDGADEKVFECQRV